MYKLIEHSDNYSKTFRILHRFRKEEPKNPITDSESFKFKSRFLNNINTEGINKELAMPLKLLSNFWRTLEMPLINCEINVILT